MKLNTLIVALFVAGVIWVCLPRLSQGQTAGITVIATMYTCDNHPRNPMYPCGPLRWGGNRNSAGMACPVSWRNRKMEVPGYGVLRCDDTGAYDTWNGLPHIDIRVSSYEQAAAFGFRRMVIYPTGASTAAAPAPTARAVVPAAPAAPVVPVAPVAAVVAPAAPAAPVAAVAAPVTPAAPVAAIAVPSMGVASADAAIGLAKTLAPAGDASTAQARSLTLNNARIHFAQIVEGVAFPADQPLWIVTMWVPAEHVPAGTVSRPDANAPVAARFFVFNPWDGTLLSESYVSAGVIETMGWLQSEPLHLP